MELDWRHKKLSPTIWLQLHCPAVRSDKKSKPQKFKLKTLFAFFSPSTLLLYSHIHTAHTPHIHIHSNAEHVNSYPSTSQKQQGKRKVNDLELNMIWTFSLVSHKVSMSKFTVCSVYIMLYFQVWNPTELQQLYLSRKNNWNWKG